MDEKKRTNGLWIRRPAAQGERDSAGADSSLSRRGFLLNVGGAAALGGMWLMDPPDARGAFPMPEAARAGLPPGVPLRIRPVLVYALPERREKTSWRPYGGLKNRDDVDREARRIEEELKELAKRAEFPVQVLPIVLVGNGGEAAAASKGDLDALLVYASGGAQEWLEALAASGKPNVMFLRHRSGPFYLWYEIAHFRFLRKSEDAFRELDMDVNDIVVDDYGEVLWRLRALYGLKNAKGTKCLAIGGLAAYSAPGQKLGPAHARGVWGYEIETFPDGELLKRIEAARSDARVLKEVEGQAAGLLAQPNVKLRTDGKFVVNSFLALKVIREIMSEKGAANVGVANCMGSLIGLLDTPPCLVLSLLNDDGFTAFCHTDFTHTPPGVLLRWISGKPSFVSNSHFPHDGVILLAHCAAPRRMDGRDLEPVEISTHFESDYGAATKVEYRRGQITTNIIPNLACTKWVGFRGKILDSPSYEICRSQIDMGIDGDWRKLLTDMEGFHAITCYGDYLREVGYALKKVKIGWESVSA